MTPSLTAPKLSPSQQLLVAIPLGLLAVVWVIRALYLPLVARINDQRALLRDLQVKAADAELLITQRASNDAVFTQAQQAFRALDARVGRAESLASILEQLGRQAKDHRLELVAVQPKADAAGARVVTLGPQLQVREVPLTLQLTGRYRSIGEFLAELPREPFLSSIRRITMTKPQADRAQVTADVALAVYVAERSAPKAP